METIPLTLITPISSTTWHVAWLDIETPTGNVVIQPKHAPYLSLLKIRSTARFLTDKNMVEEFGIGEGVCRVERDKIVLTVTPL